MGIDFSALLKCAEFVDIDDERIAIIESGANAIFSEVGELWRASGFFSLEDLPAGWVTAEVNPHSIERPQSLTRAVGYRTRESFYLTFGKDCIAVYHPLRLYTFLTNGPWKVTMITACQRIARLVDATDGLITRDESPVIGAFHRGASYEAAIRQGVGEWGEVQSVAELYERHDPGTWDSHGYWHFMRHGQLRPIR
jgi:hypothetical protein